MAQDVDAPLEPAWTGRLWSSHIRDAFVAGRRLHYLDVGEGPVVLLVHGLGASWQVWYKNIADLSQDHRVIAVDLPGFGYSQALSRPTRLNGFADSLAGLLELIGVDKAVVVGHSLGGLIVQRLAAEHPERVAALMLVASGDGVVDVRQAVAFRGMAVFSSALRLMGPSAFLFGPALSRVLAVPGLQRRLISQVVHDPDSVPSELAALMILSVLRSPALADAITAGLRRDMVTNVASISCPVIVLAGARDRLVPGVSVSRLAAAIPLARHEVWADVGHHPMLERADEFNSLVRRFTAGVPGGSSDHRA